MWQTSMVSKSPTSVRRSSRRPASKSSITNHIRWARRTMQDRFYRIYVSDKLLAGAYVAGQFYDERSARLQLQQAALFFGPFVRRCLIRRQEREAFYDSSDPFSPPFLEHDQRNFQIERMVVARTRLRRRRSLWTPINAGVLELELLDGSIRRFILAGEQHADDVLELLRTFDPWIEVSGKAEADAAAKAARRRRGSERCSSSCF